MQIENLVRAGAFDRLDPNRARLFAGAETILRRAQADQEEKESGQIGLFGGVTSKPEPLRLPDIPTGRRWSDWRSRPRPIGFHLTAHPLDAYAQALRRIGVTQSIHVEARAAAGVSRVKIAGTVVATKERITRTGSRMAWVRISDAAGSVEVTCFSEVLGRSREFIGSGSNVLVTAELKTEGEAVRVTAMDVMPLDQAAASAGASIRIWLRETAPCRTSATCWPRKRRPRPRHAGAPDRQRAGRGDRPARRLQRNAQTGAGPEIVARRRPGGGGLVPRQPAPHSALNDWIRALQYKWLVDEDPNRTLLSVIREIVVAHGDNLALQDETNSLTYRALVNRADGYARWALEQKLKKGDVVSLMLPNSPTMSQYGSVLPKLVAL